MQVTSGEQLPVAARATESGSEVVPCPVCGEAETRVLYAGPGFAIGRCVDCGLVRQNPRLTAETLRRIDYDGAAQQDLAKTLGARGYEGLEDWETKPREAFTAGIRFVEAVRPVGAPKGLWVDVGASTGGLLVVARDAGWRTGGCDVGAGQVRICRERHGLDVRHGTLAEVGFSDGAAEVVSYRQVLEHVHDLDGELREARRVLQPGGLLLVEVPHGGGLHYLLGAMNQRLGVVENHWATYNVPQHLYYFRRKGLARVLARNGFEVLRSETYGKYRRKRSLIRRIYDGIRDGLRLGNKLRLVARATARP